MEVSAEMSDTAGVVDWIGQEGPQGAGILVQRSAYPSHCLYLLISLAWTYNWPCSPMHNDASSLHMIH